MARIVVPTKIGSGNRYVTCRKNNVGEWVCRLWIDGKHYAPADYFATDPQDASDTMQAMYYQGLKKNPRKPKRIRKNTIPAKLLASAMRSAVMRRNPSEVLGGKSIGTKYLPPSNVRGARIKAFVIDGNRIQKSLTVSFDYGLDEYERHLDAAIQMRDKMNWKGDLVGVGSRDGYVFGFKDHVRAKRNPSKSRAFMHVERPGSVKRKHFQVHVLIGGQWHLLGIGLKSKESAVKLAQRYHRLTGKAAKVTLK